MQVGPCCPACISGKPEQFSSLYLFPGFYRKFTQVAVVTLVSVAVSDNYQFSIAAAVACIRDYTVPGGVNFRTHGTGQVDSLVETEFLNDFVILAPAVVNN